MKKHKIIIPKEYLYLGEVQSYSLDGIKVNEPLKLFKGVFNKKLPNVGGTTLVLQNDEKVILVSPRNQLLINKYKQTPNSLLINADNKADIEEYIRTTDIPKILTTYDSLPKVLTHIKDIDNWHIIVDEFQMILLDSGFKSEIEQSLIDMIKYLNVTFLSATPLSESCLVYLSKIFNDLEYYELEYERPIQKIQIQRIESNSPIKAIIKILNEYYVLGNYPIINNIPSKEVVVFLNSVTNIIKIIKTLSLNADEVNIICADSTDNLNKIKKNLGNDFTIGEIAINKEDNKKYTFVTSTAFEGVDFYSDNAATFIVSDTITEHTTIDIEFELQQIVGRQRLEENIFRMYPFLIYNCRKKRSDKFISEYLEQMEIIEERTERELARLNSITNEDDIKLEAKKLNSLQMVTNYEESYSIYNEHLKKFVFNRCYKLNQLFKLDYYRNSINGVYLYGQINNTNNMITNEHIQTINFSKEDIKNIMVQTDSFRDIMKKYIDSTRWRN